MKTKRYLLTVFFLLLIQLIALTQEINVNPNKQKEKIQNEIITIEGGTESEADDSMRELLSEKFAIISDNTIEEIIATKKIVPIFSSDSTGEKLIFGYNVNYSVPKNFLIDTAKILWVLNIPEFRSHLYQLYNGDTIYIDTWNNVVGKAATKTYTGYFEAFRIRNWPSWKDPEKPLSTATPPGPKNPLGLFCVHYDESSLRYFHGTNKEYLLSTTMRNLSHGCVRNENGNIQKMKEFIIKRVIKSQDLSSWFGSKRSMTFEFARQDRFPVKIIYKTFSVGKDEDGIYIEKYQDIYGYGYRHSKDKYNDDGLITMTTEENVLTEYYLKFGKNIPEDKLRKAISNIISTGKYYEKNYINEEF
jgi:hypothetical protein